MGQRNSRNLDYAWARSAAILSESFIGPRLDAALACRTVADLALLTFPRTDFRLTEKALVRALQEEMVRRSLRQVLGVWNQVEPLPAILSWHLAGLEFAWLKQALGALSHGEELPPLPELGRFARLHGAAFPDLGAMTRNTPWSWLPEKVSPQNLRNLECRLDTQYHAGLLDAASASAAMPGGQALLDVISCELSLRNAVWALRMRSFYGWELAQARDWLAGSGPALLGPARRVFSLPLDNRAAWTGWRFLDLLPPQTGETWQADPVGLEERAAVWLYRKTWHLFHTQPCTITALYAFARLKEFESDSIGAIAEGLQLGLAAVRMRELAGCP